MKSAAVYTIAIAGALILAGATCSWTRTALMVSYRRPAHAFAGWGRA